METNKFNSSSVPMEMSEDDGNNGDYMQLAIESNQMAQGTCWSDDELPTDQHLKLDISDSFLAYVRLMLASFRNDYYGIKYYDRSRCAELSAARNQLSSVKNSKEVPTELPLLSLSVGDTKLIHTAECDIFARFYYLAKKIVCQMRIGTLSRKVVVPFSHITALHARFDDRGFDSVRIEVSFNSFSAVNARPGKFLNWKGEDPEDVNSFPESKCIFLEMEQGVLEKGFAKLLYTDPRLECVVSFSSGTSSSDQRMHHGRVNAQMHQTNMSALYSLASNTVFPLHWGVDSKQ